jgi:hypothetical protein
LRQRQLPGVRLRSLTVTYCSKELESSKPGGGYASILTSTPPLRAQSAVFDHLQDSAGARQGRFRASYSDHVLPSCYTSSSGLQTKKQTEVAHDIQGRGERAPNMVMQRVSSTTLLHVEFSRRKPPSLHSESGMKHPFPSIYIPGPSQCPRVDKPHSASESITVTETRSAVAGFAWKDVARNGPYYMCYFEWKQ